MKYYNLARYICSVFLLLKSVNIRTTQLGLGSYPTSSTSCLLGCFLMAMPWLRRAGRLTPLAAAVYSSDVRRWRTQADDFFCVWFNVPRSGVHWIYPPPRMPVTSRFTIYISRLWNPDLNHHLPLASLVGGRFESLDCFFQYL